MRRLPLDCCTPVAGSSLGGAGLVERLAPVRIAALYSSPLERCRETAEPLAAARRLEVRDTEDIGEVRYGEWTGRTLAQLSKTRLWRSVQATPSTVRFPGGETLLEVQQRAVRQAADIATAHPRGVVAVVSHGDVIRLLLAHFAGLHVDLFQRLVVSPASVSVATVMRYDCSIWSPSARTAAPKP